MTTSRDDHFEALLDAAPDAMVAVRPDGLIALFNTQAERLFGYQRDELIGHPIEVLVPDSVRAVHPGHRAGYFADPHSRPMGVGIELAGRRKDATEFPAEISLSALHSDEGTIVLTAVRDISVRLEFQAEREALRAQAERERMEAQLHQSQRLESLGQLAGGVAHDFNNLLGSMINYAAFVSEAIAAVPPGAGPEYWNPVLEDVQQITAAGKRASDLVHQLLAFARREVVRPQVLDIHSVIEGLTPFLRRTIGEDVDLDLALGEEIWPMLADLGQIEQVIVNLCVNARDAMPAGGTLTVDTTNIDADADFAAHHIGCQPGKYVRVRVSDTGSGMTPEVLARAFEPFFTTKPEGEGSGLGLATVHGIVNQAGGYVQAYSEAGFGTTVSVLLPATEGTARVEVTRDAFVPSRGGETVLIVEDENGMREVTRRILTRNGYAVITAGGGAEALELATHHPAPIDLLLTDVIMPRMLGKEVAARLRTVQPGLKVLFMSGYAQPILASRGTLEPGVTLVEKPFTEAALLDKVREVLDS